MSLGAEAVHTVATLFLNIPQTLRRKKAGTFCEAFFKFPELKLRCVGSASTPHVRGCHVMITDY